MAQMAKGAEVIKGTHTASTNTGGGAISFGKTINKYMFLIEMTEDSKTSLMGSGTNANRSYAFCGVFQTPKIGDLTITDRITVAYRVNPTSKAFSVSTTDALIASDTSISNVVSNVASSGAHYFLNGFSYNYIIVSLDNV